MKKTFKGYSALIALLIALLVVTAMPITAMAAGETTTDDDGTLYYLVGSQKHELDTENDVIVKQKQDCGHDGITIYKCKYPGCPDGEHAVTEPATGKHTKVYEFVSGATCETGGEVKVKCSVCGADLGTETSPAGAHVFKDGAFYTYDIVKGEQVDGDTYIDLYGWLYNYYAVDKDAINVTQDLIDYRDAQNANNLKSQYNLVIDSIPTCQKEGSAHFVCTECNKAVSKTYKIAVDPRRHTWTEWEAMEGDNAPTCTETGYEERYCIEPGHANQAVFQTRVAQPLGHNYKIVKVTEYTDPGCYPSKIQVTCTRCKDTQVIGYDELSNDPYSLSGSQLTKKHEFKKNVPYEGHEKNENVKVVDGKYVVVDCTKPAVMVYKCDNWDTDATTHASDSDAIKVVERAATGHDWSAWTTVAKSTDTKPGFFTRYCKVCNEIENKTGWLVDGKVVDKDGNEAVALTVAVDLSDVKDGEGTAKVTVATGELADETKLYARVGWFYVTDDGLTYGFIDRKNVEIDENGAMTVDVSGPNPGDGFNFTGIQVVISADKDIAKIRDWGPLSLGSNQDMVE